MAVAAVTQPIARRGASACAAALAYALVAARRPATPRRTSLWVNLLVPGALLLTGYWLSDCCFASPQPWLEAVAASNRQGTRSPPLDEPAAAAWSEILEASYAAAYVVVGGGAIFAATAGIEAVAFYWRLVLDLGARLICSAAVAAVTPATGARREPWHGARESLVTVRRFSTPESGFWTTRACRRTRCPADMCRARLRRRSASCRSTRQLGRALLVMAGLIAIAAIAGRYHYVVDCVAGVAVSLAVWSLM